MKSGHILSRLRKNISKARQYILPSQDLYISGKSLEDLHRKLDHVAVDLAVARELRDSLHMTSQETLSLLRQSAESLHHHLHNVKQVANLVARRQPTGRRIRVVFLIHHIEAWDSIADIYETMRLAEDFDPIIASINRRFPGESDYAHEELFHEKLSSMEIPHLRFNMDDSYQALDILKALAPDIIFRQSPWDGDVPPGFSTMELRFARLCYIPYEILSILRTRDLDQRDPSLDSDWYRSCWRMFRATECDLENVTASLKTQNTHVLCTGHPKVARLIREGRKNANWPVTPSRNGTFRLIWSPHHSVDERWNRFGMFHLVYRDMLDWARSDDSVEIVFSPHPALLSKLTEPGGVLAPQELDRFLEEWLSLPNTGMIQADHYAGVMHASDALISDGMSFLMEYQLFNKPVLYLERPDHVAFSRSGERIVEGVHRLSGVAQARALVTKFQNGFADPLAEKQRDLIRWLSAKGDAVHNILEAIRTGIAEETVRAE